MKIIIKLSVVFLGLIISCTNNDPNGIQTSDTELILMSLLDEDDAIGMDGFGSDGDMDVEHEIGLESEESLGRSLSDTLQYGEGYRIRFGRRISEREKSVEFEVNGDTAIGSVTYNISGEFIVRAIDTTNFELIDSLGFNKQFSSYFYRNIRFVKVDDVSNPDGYRWKIDALTPLTGGTGDKVQILNISIYSLDSLFQVSELLYSFDINESGQLYMNRDNLLRYTAFSRILILAEVSNNEPEFTMDSSEVGERVFVNYGRNNMQRGRRSLQDHGLFFDQTANDNIHSGGIRVHGPGLGQARGIFRTFFETIDLATLYISDGGYNTSVWSIPYVVERQ